MAGLKGGSGVGGVGGKQAGRAETRSRLVGLKGRLQEVEEALQRRCGPAWK